MLTYGIQGGAGRIQGEQAGYRGSRQDTGMHAMYQYVILWALYKNTLVAVLYGNQYSYSG